jgi:ubiquitin-conjugating enzyme E2 C
MLVCDEIRANVGGCSASPLNGQAAELWDSDPAEYQRLVLARHKTPEELDAGGL